MVKRLVASGAWTPVHRGVYRSSDVPASWHQFVLAATLLRPGAAWASHQTAARLLGIAGGWEDPIEISVSRDLRTSNSLHVFRIADPGPFDRREVLGIPALSAERTLIDLATVVNDKTLEDALDDVLIKRLSTVPKLEWRLSKLRKGTRGKARVAALVEKRKTRSDVVDSRLERLLF
jgi:hypothetical protein